MVHKLILQVGFFSYAQIYVSMLNFTSAGSNVNLSQKKIRNETTIYTEKKKKKKKRKENNFLSTKITKKKECIKVVNNRPVTKILLSFHLRKQGNKKK